jgi:hydroxymethylglutaryl-CoA synthase
MTSTPLLGIDDISVYIPNLYLPISELARHRQIDQGKLESGLGLRKMALPDVNEDVVTMAAEAIIDLIDKNQLSASEIGRIYVGTESSVDASKPIGSYILGIINQYYKSKGVPNAMKHCDTVDMTFACIGAVDAMQNALDWIRIHPAQKAIVVATDVAKYDLDSTGEYTQGAGAIAMIICENPRCIAIQDDWGIASSCEHDFYKPVRKAVDPDEVVSANGVPSKWLAKEVISIHKDTPIYDGQYSNICYQDRITEAFQHLLMTKTTSWDPLSEWSRLIFHLPYAFHARRFFTTIYIRELVRTEAWTTFLKHHHLDQYLEKDVNVLDQKDASILIKTIRRTKGYQDFVLKKIEKGERASSEVGNIYTGSIFLSLVSTLEADYHNDTTMGGKKIGFFAYGSGSKSKVFWGIIQPSWKQVIHRIRLFEALSSRQEIPFHLYDYLHRERLTKSLSDKPPMVYLDQIGFTETNRYARYYRYRTPEKIT